MAMAMTVAMSFPVFPWLFQGNSRRLDGSTIGIQDADTKELWQAPSFSDLAESISLIVSAYHVVTYNVAFDIPFLQYQYVKSGLRVPKINATCAMRIFSAFLNTDTNMSLEYACRVLGIKQEQYGVPHRALSDVLVTIELLKNMLLREGVFL
jgi:DNA polymerase III epsilon subunit-like protein